MSIGFSTTYQSSQFDAAVQMNPQTKKLLDRSWASVIRAHIYGKIDEHPFEPLYADQQGTLDFPIKALLTLEVIKDLQDLTDRKLIEKYCFDYLVNYAVGLTEQPLSEDILYDFRERVYKHSLTHPSAADLLFASFTALTQDPCLNGSAHLEGKRVAANQIIANILQAGQISVACDTLIMCAKKIPVHVQTKNIKAILDPSFRKGILRRLKPSELDYLLTLTLLYCEETITALARISVAEVRVDNEIQALERLLEKPQQEGVNRQRPRAQRLNIQDFYFNSDFTAIEKCPSGQMATGRKAYRNYISARFSKRVCGQCPQLPQCLIIKGQEYNTIRFSKKQVEALQTQKRDSPVDDHEPVN